jgi:flavorubredoxin
MESKVTEIAPDTYRISTFHPDYAIQFNQFLINDDEPFLMHTGFKRMFQTTLAGVSSIIDPAKLRWIGFSHFESDECGALNEFLGVAPRAQAVCSVVGAMVMVNDFADRAPRPLADNEVLQTGRHRLQFLATPHVPHCWDAGLFFDKAERTLLCSDLFFQPGDPEPVIESDIVGRARDAINGSLDCRSRTTCPTLHTRTALSNGSLPWSQQRSRSCTVLRFGATAGRPFLTLLP